MWAFIAEHPMILQIGTINILFIIIWKTFELLSLFNQNIPDTIPEVPVTAVITWTSP